MRIAVLVLGLGLCATADEVLLTSGGKLVGKIISESPDEIVIETKSGKIGIPDAKKEVVSIKYGRTVIHEYYEKFDGVKNSRSESEFVELASWCEQNEVSRFARKLYEKVIQINPENETARRRLGFKLYKGKWLTEEEIMLDKGMEKFEGKWVSPSEKALALKRKADQDEERKQRQEEAKRRDEERKRAEIARLEKYYEDYFQRGRYDVWGPSTAKGCEWAPIDVTNLPYYWKYYGLYRTWGWPSWAGSGTDPNNYHPFRNPTTSWPPTSPNPGVLPNQPWQIVP